jgi:nitric oxide reductase NorD protein
MSTHAPETLSDLGRFYALFPQPDLARDLFNLVEGHRVDARLRLAYPGIRRDMKAIAQATVERRDPIGPGASEAQAVMEGLLTHTLSAVPDLSPLPAAVAALVTDAIALMDRVLVPETTVADSAQTAAALYELIDDGARRAQQTPFTDQTAGDELSAPESDGADDQDEAAADQDAAGPGGGADEYSSLDMPPFMTPVLEELVKQRAKEQTESSDQGDQAGETAEAEQAAQTQHAQPGAEHQGDEAVQRSNQNTDQVPVSPGEAPDGLSDDMEGTGADMDLRPAGEVPLVDRDDDETDEDLGEQTFYYDEWDHNIEDYRPAWCTLRESRSTRINEGFVAATFYEHGGVVSQIRRNFQLMRPERLRKMRYQTDGDDIDIEGIVEYVVDRKTRISPTERVYIKRDKKDRDVATAFLVDMSSSTDRKIDDRKRIIDIEKESLLLMCEALEAIRDEYSIYGFSGSGRDDCQFYTVKAFGERYDDRVRGRIGGIYGRQKTRMGPALRHATKQLMAVDAHVKLLILLTDGKPYDSDTYQDNTYAQEDTKMALREARREKIHLFCVTVDQEGADYLPHMYSDANFVVVDDVRTLPQKLPQLYRRLTT